MKKSKLHLFFVTSLMLTVAAEAGLKIYYIRHGEGGHNVKKDYEKRKVPKAEWPSYVGNPNVFTPLGLTQVAKVSDTLQGLEPKFDFIVSSPLWRCRNTILPYMKAVGAKGEVWPELAELYVSADHLFDTDLPAITEPILGAANQVVLPDDESAFFSLRADGQRNYKRRKYSDPKMETAAAVLIYQAGIDRILEKFDGTDKAVLVAGHGASGKNLIRLLTKSSRFDSIKNTGIWMVEQQPDGSFEPMMYNTVPLQAKPDAKGKVTVRFDDIKADLANAKINGKGHRSSTVTMSKAADGLDIVYSFATLKQDFDGQGGHNDSIRWDIRVRGFKNSRISAEGSDSSVVLGEPSQTYMSDRYFGVSDKRYVDAGDSIQFSVENVELTAAKGTKVKFNGFDTVYGSDDSYIFGIGAGGLECRVTIEDGDFKFEPTRVLTLSCPTDKFRVSDLGGSFTVTRAQ